MRTLKHYSLALAALSAAPAASAAQEREQSDSLARQVYLLQQRVDSLERLISSRTGPAADTVGAPADELAALRAAAQAALQEGDSTPEPDTTGVRFVGRTRTLNQLNPEISVTGDVRLRANRPGPQAENVDLREFEFAFQSPLDPFSTAKVYVTFDEGELDIEEAYAYWSGLPGHLRLDFGRFRQQFGELNRWHLHALPETEYPLVLSHYVGEEGLVGDGVGLYWIVPTSRPAVGTHELWAQLTLGNNEVLFHGGDRLSFLGHLNSFWQLSPSTFFQLGWTAVYGEHPDSALKSRVFGTDFRVTWTPPERAQYRSFTVRGEGYAARREVAGVGDTRWGGYIGARYQLTRRLFVGARYDYVELLEGPSDHEWALSPYLVWWQSEWVRLRAEWRRHSVPLAGGLRDSSDGLVLQAVWSMGPHKHETY